MGAMMLWFLGDLVMFPDAPIHRCVEGGNYGYTHHPDGYCGKQGQAHTSVDFRRFEFWQGGLFLLWPVGIVALAVLTKSQRKG